MALILMDGFDYNVLGDCWDAGSFYATTTGRFGVDGSLDNSGFGQETFKTFAANKSEIITGGGLMFVHTNTGPGVVRFYDGSTQQCTVCRESDGSLSLRRGSSGGTLITATAAGIMPVAATGVWAGVSFRVKFHGSAGEFQVWKDGVSILNVGSLNTITTANAYATKMSLVGENSGRTRFDDWYVFDTSGSINNAFPGDVRIYPLNVNAAGSTTQWTPDSGSNYARVSSPSYDGDSSYVSDNVVNHVDEYAHADLPGTLAGAMLAMSLITVARKDDAGLRQMVSSINSGGTLGAGSTVTLGAGYATHVDFFELDPNTSAQWASIAAVNAVKSQIKVAA